MALCETPILFLIRLSHISVLIFLLSCTLPYLFFSMKKNALILLLQYFLTPSPVGSIAGSRIRLLFRSSYYIGRVIHAGNSMHWVEGG